MFVPNYQKVYGSLYLVIHPTSGFKYFKTYMSQITVTKHHIKELDQPSERCSDDPLGNPNTTQCIASYIVKELGCNPRIMGSVQLTSKMYCNSSSQLQSLANITRWFTKSNANKVHKTTGCLASCERDEYATIKHSLTEKMSLPIKDLHLFFIIPSGSYEEKEEYLLYDSHSFIAEIGGFLGLLLGWTLYSIYDQMVDLMVRLKNIMTRF